MRKQLLCVIHTTFQKARENPDIKNLLVTLMKIFETLLSMLAALILL